MFGCACVRCRLISNGLVAELHTLALVTFVSSSSSALPRPDMDSQSLTHLTTIVYDNSDFFKLFPFPACARARSLFL